MDGIEDRLSRIEQMLETLVKAKTVKDWYSVEEVAEIVSRESYTVREWCRQGRVRASKRPCGRGRAKEWVVSHDELTRLRNEGLLPIQMPSRSLTADGRGTGVNTGAASPPSNGR
jgi:hypothetical protein